MLPIVKGCRNRRKGTEATLPLLPVVLMLPRESRQAEEDRGREANHHHPPTGPPNKTRNTTSPAAPMLPELSECSRCPDAVAPQDRKKGSEGTRDKGSPQPTDKTSQQGTKSRSKEAKQSRRQASKPLKKGPPPIGRVQAAFPLITNSRQKISKKSLGVVLKKISEKFFVGMFRGKEKPLAFLNGRGDCLINLTNNGKCK